MSGFTQVANNITLSSDGDTASSSAGVWDIAVEDSTSHYTFSMLVNSGTGPLNAVGIGVTTDLGALTGDNYLGEDSAGATIGYYNTGDIWFLNTVSYTGQAFSDGATVQVKGNSATGMMSFSADGGATWAGPFQGPKGVVFPAACLQFANANPPSVTAA